MKHIFIINPVAGKGVAVRSVMPQVENYAKTHPDFDYKFYITRSAGDGQRFAKEMAETGEPMRLYACGGDGTLYEVANGAFGFDNVEIGCIPSGSGNDYIRLFGTTEQFQDIAAQIEGKSATLDAMRCGDKIALNQCSMGFDAETCNQQKHFKNMKIFNGETSYVASLLYCFIKKMNHTFTITIGDDEPFTADVLFCVAGNSRWYGGGFLAAPFAMPNDGLLDIVIIKKELNKLGLLTLVKPYKEGRLINYKSTIFKRATKVKIQTDVPATVNIDGECEQSTEAVFELLPKSVRFIIPKTSSFFDDCESGILSNKIEFEKYKFK